MDLNKLDKFAKQELTKKFQSQAQLRDTPRDHLLLFFEGLECQIKDADSVSTLRMFKQQFFDSVTNFKNETIGDTKPLTSGTRNKDFLKLLNPSVTQFKEMLEHNIHTFNNFVQHLRTLLDEYQLNPKSENQKSPLITFEDLNNLYKNLKAKRLPYKTIPSKAQSLFTHFSVPILIDQLNEKVKLLEKSFIDFSNPKITFESLHQKLVNCSELVKPKFIKDDRIFTSKSFHDLFQSCRFDHEFSDGEFFGNYYFDKKESVTQFLEGVEKHGINLFSKRSSLMERLGLRLHGFEHLKHIKTVKDLSAETNVIPVLYCVKVVNVDAGKLTIDTESLKIKDEIIEKLVSLHTLLKHDTHDTQPKITTSTTSITSLKETSQQTNNTNLKKSHKDFLQFFEKALCSLEESCGCILDTNYYKFGGLYTIVAKINDVQRHQFETVRNLLDTKIKNKYYPYSINLGDHITNQTNQIDEEFRLFEKIITKYYLTVDSDRFVPFVCFRSQVKSSSHLWRIHKQETPFKFVYLADLLVKDSNFTKLKARGLSLTQVLELRGEMWASFSKRTSSKIKRQNIESDLTRILNSDKKLYLRVANGTLTRMLDFYKSDLEKLLQSLNDLRLGNNQYKYAKYVFNWVNKNMLESMTPLNEVCKLLRERLELSSVSNEKKIMLLTSFFRAVQPSENFIHYKQNKLIKMYTFLDKVRNETLNQSKRTQDYIRLGQPIKNVFNQTKDHHIVSWYKAWIQDLETLLQNSSQEKISLRSRFNQFIRMLYSKLQKSQEDDLINVFCLLVHFEIYTSPVKVTKKNDKKVTLANLKSFVGYLKSNFQRLDTMFRNSQNLAKFEKELQKLVLTKIKDKNRQRQFLSYLLLECNVNFSEQMATDYLLKVTESQIPKDEIVSSKIEKILDCLESKDNFTQNHKSDFGFWNKSKSQQVSDFTIKACRRNTPITYEELVSINLETLGPANLRKHLVWKYILQRVLSGDNLEKISQDLVKTEFPLSYYILAVYELCDQTCKRVLASFLYKSNNPIPLCFVNRSLYCFLLPLSGLTCKAKKQKSIESINPFFHRCIKVLFLKRQGTSGSIEKIANDLFCSQAPVFIENTLTRKLRKPASFATFVTNLDPGNKLDFFDLSMVTLYEKFHSSTLDKSVKFLVKFSDVVVYLRKEEETQGCSYLYNYVSSKNHQKPEDQHTLLLELIQSDGEVHPFKFDRYWRKRILYSNSNKNISDQIRDVILFQKNNFSLGNKLQSLHYVCSIPDKKVFYKDDSYIDLHDNQTGLMIRNSSKILSRLLLCQGWAKKNAQNSFLLQSRFHAKELQILKEKTKLTVLQNKIQKDHFYRNQIHNFRIEQLDWICRTAGGSLVFEFWHMLQSSFREDRLEFLVFLDNLLAEQKVLNVFKAEYTRLRVLHFVRELQHIFEVLFYFIKLQKQDTLFITRLNQIPIIFAHLFLKLYPMEVFNGEYLSVPNTFLGEMINQLSLLTVKNPKVAVVSVLGLQSSGKSTFLNNLFHLNFSAKDDKCTRGSSAVFLKVNMSDTSDSSGLVTPDYLILVDTEGLGSPENLASGLKGQTKHGSSFKDDKTMLFNLGISNLCIVNSMKEFKKEMVYVIQKMMSSLGLLFERKVSPEISFVFQGIPDDKKKRSEIYKTSSSMLEQIFSKENHRNKLTQQKIQLSDIIDKDRNSVFCISKLNSLGNYSTEYTKSVRDYLSHIFSSSMLCQRKHMRSFSHFTDLLNKINKIIIDDRFFFDGNLIKERTRRHFMVRFESKLKKDMALLIREVSTNTKTTCFNFQNANKLELFQRIFYTPKEEMQLLEFKPKVFEVFLNRFLHRKKDFVFSSYEDIIPQIKAFEENSIGYSRVSTKLKKIKNCKKFLEINRQNKVEKDSLIKLLETRHLPYIDQSFKKAFDSYFISNKDSLEVYRDKVYQIYQEIIEKIETQEKGVEDNKFNLKSFSAYLRVLEKYSRDQFKQLERDIMALSLEKDELHHEAFDKYTEVISSQINDFCFKEESKLLGCIRKKNEKLLQTFNQLEEMLNQYINKEDLITELFEKIKENHICSALLDSDSDSDFDKKNIAKLLKEFEPSKILSFLYDKQYALSFCKNQFETNHKSLLQRINLELDRFEVFYFDTSSNDLIPKPQIQNSLFTNLIAQIVKSIKENFDVKNTHSKYTSLIHKYTRDIVILSLKKYLTKITKTKSYIIYQIKDSLFKCYRYDFESKQLSFDGLTWHQLLKNMFYKMLLHFHNHTFTKASQEIRNQLRRLEDSDLDQVLDPTNHTRRLETKYLQMSKHIQSQSVDSFLKDLLEFSKHVPQKLEASLGHILQTQGKAERIQNKMIHFITNEYKAKLQHFDKLLNSADNGKPPVNIYRLSNHFFKQPAEIQVDPKISLQISHHEQDTKASITNTLSTGYYWKYRELIRKLVASINMSKSKFDSFYQDLVATVSFERVCDKKLILEMCGRVCSSCNGICVSSRHHKGRHIFYHVPVIKDSSVSFHCFESFEKAVKKPEEGPSNLEVFNEEFPSGSHLFWKYMMLKYGGRISKLMGLSCDLIDRNHLSGNDKKIST